MKNKEFQKKIEETMSSLDGIKRAEANPFLYTRVIALSRQTNRLLIQPKVIWRVAASLFIIVALNISIGLYSRPQKVSSSPSTEDGYFTNHIYHY
jgi:hypothetical protein